MQPLTWCPALNGKLHALFSKKQPAYGWSSHIRWPLLSMVVGVFAGLGAIFFEELLKITLYHLLRLPTGYMEPIRGERPALIATLASTRTWLFLLIPTLGGLAAGLLVFLLAPEAEGHGTDAMIDAFHHFDGFIRKRVPPVKILASALTIGSGGSAGKEGPIAQTGAGLASILASFCVFPHGSGASSSWRAQPVGSALSSMLRWAPPCSLRKSSTGRPSLNSKPSCPALCPRLSLHRYLTSMRAEPACSFRGRSISNPRNSLLICSSEPSAPSWVMFTSRRSTEHETGSSTR